MNLIIFEKSIILPVLIFFIAITIGAFAHGYNMFNYPYFENDEGTYFSQAYSIAYEGKLTNYTYWYDHAPVGWMQVAAWMRLTGGPFAFGYSLYSARIFMLIVHILSSILLFLIVKKITKRDWVSGLAVIIFSLSPLALYFQRRLLLDNIMTFWMLLAFTLIIYSKQRFSWILVASLSLLFSILSKEAAVFALPGYLYLVTKTLTKKQRFIGFVAFLSPIVLGATYLLLYPMLKNELFPGPGHVSFIGTWAHQLTRSTGVAPWKLQSEFMLNVMDWFGKDPFFLTASIISTVLALVLYRKSYQVLSLAVITICFWAFFARGGTVINFYFIPVIALSSIIISLIINDISKIKYVGKVLVLLFLLGWFLTINGNAWVLNETRPQIESTEWIKKNLNPNSILAVDNSQLLDLQKSRYPGDPAFTKAHWFWKVSEDPEIKNGLLASDWQNINYVVLTHEYLKQMKVKSLDFLEPTITHSQELITIGSLSGETYLDLNKRISTNGDWVKVLKVDNRNQVILSDSWLSYKENFISPEGKVLDPQKNLTSSEGQAYAMLRAVMIGDRNTFDSVWGWTRSHLQFRNEDKLFSWKWGIGPNGKESVIDSSPATDADIDIATSLILASRKWRNPTYENKAKIIIGDIWKNEVVNLNSNYYLLAGTWAGYGNSIIVNPSYISPAAFRLFAEVDKEHNWNGLANDSYVFLNRLAAKSKVGLIPDWASVDKATESIEAPIEKDFGANFSYDAMRIHWRIAQDYYWFSSTDAKIFLSKQIFLRDYFNSNKKIPDIISTQGKVNISSGESNAFYGSFLPFFQITDKGLYEKLNAKIQADYKDGAWKESNNYYTQNWVWLGLALLENKYNYEK